MPEAITDNLDLWSSVLLTKSTAGRGSNGKLEAYGIKKLRELIYELAAKGLLLDVDSDTAAKTAKIGDVADLVMGQAPPGNECNKDGAGTIFVKTGEFGELYPEVVEWTTKPLKLAKAGDVLICVVGATVGKLNLAIDCAIGRSVAAIRPRRDIDPKYLYFSLMPYTLKLRSQSRGSAQGVIGKEELNAVEIRLPSLKEQHRIVAKVDELMALCDQLEQQQARSIEAHQSLVETLLGTLTRTGAQQEFSAAWARITSHFDALFTTEASIDQLKQTILQLAVMGKLVPQDPNDEPANELLKKIAAEKEKLVKVGKIKKEKLLPPIGADEKIFELPARWSYCRLDEICIGITSGSTPPQSEFSENSGIPYLKVYNIRNQAIDFEYKSQFISEQYSSTKLRKSILYPGDVVMNIVGPPLGKVAIIPSNYPQWNCNQAIVFFRPAFLGLGGFIYTYLKAGLFLRNIELIGTAGQDNISVTKSRSVVLPMPPLNEQHRIVAKVDELTALCDALKARLADAQAIQIHLADAIVEQAVC